MTTRSSDIFSLSSFAVINKKCPIDHNVFGSNAARFVIGELPDALELEFDFEAMRTMVTATTNALATMTALSTKEQPHAEPDAEDSRRSS